ncbi:hypothetical protein QLQ12_24750 [Actinoplanes sp. NEAU-A12]|uniref:DUF1707 domain-containing protein n=2 Tax=Actinoplanes sandaracinus TaxID=3045177 RepID=A0ABT6WQ07_9ACTN|nr:hypothetical protein [Actinoplanes sandaracinus]
MTQTDHLIAAYLARVERAASHLPTGRREELLGDLREHIEIVRAESGTGTEAEIRTILDRLGDPESIVAAADTQTDLPRVPAAPPTPPPPTAAPPMAAPPMPAPPFAPARPATPSLRPLWFILGGLAVLGVLVLCLGTLFLSRDGESLPNGEYLPPPPAPTERITTTPPTATTATVGP